ncbi:hypothetical protein P170DRAFT_463166 [Aspergillus steynii IBT 23096]|uniref:DUF6536 domain-containing protein n=1 Tax=Aspergillus steynii IBT 23096 TaxID=1392250 RepID=A0A2I2GKU1_9EURO|nr:uncharacterized protein P170DRAFT_463166 [Aspergillus steynii IBT 23096]PLB53494.1 hypothetical protein P170DRAFT_463166 [Aspergillus steynii IBT 23096]
MPRNWLNPRHFLNRKPNDNGWGQFMLRDQTDFKSFNATSGSLDDVSLAKSFTLWAKKRPTLGPPKICITTASIVVGLNIVLTLVAFGIGYSKYSPNGFVTVPLYTGSCSVSKHWSIGLHVLINALGTAMLAASNYCAQYLAAPTREDVDKAHSRGSWMNIGIPSVTNIWRMKWKYKILWLVLMVTSLPNHLIYNSVILNSKSTNEYGVIVGPSDYNASKPLNVSDEVASCFPDRLRQSYSQFNEEMNTGKFEILTKRQCLDKLAVNFPSDQGTVMILSKNLTAGEQIPLASVGFGNEIEQVSAGLPSYQWMCPNLTPDGCPIPKIKEDIDHWSVYAMPWVVSEWRVTVPARNGQTLTYQKNNYTGCPDWGSEDYCLDLDYLALLGWEYGGSSAHKFNTTIHDPSRWHDSWAADVHFEQANTTCRRSSYGWIEVGYVGDSYTVDSCLSMRVEERCQLLFIPPFALIVIGCGIIKLSCIAFIAHGASANKLLTVGDAIASFLTRPDPHTTQRCLISKSGCNTGSSCWEIATQPQVLSKQRKWWWQAGSGFLWTMTICLCSVTIGVAGYLLHQGLKEPRLEMAGGTGLKSLWALGLGSVSFATIIAQIQSTMLANVLLANVPQLIVSISYYFYNALMTSMIVSAEYDSYALGSPGVDSAGNPTLRPNKPLRVTGVAEGAQRRSFFLGLPSQYSLPLMICYTVLHWLVSQSLFYIRVCLYDVHGRYVESADVNACGWSPMAIIFALALGGLMFLMPFLMGMRRFRSRIPLAASCSVAISAACHPPMGDSYAAYGNVVWGEIIPTMGCIGDESESQEKGIPHCSFTSQEVRVPSVNTVYV